MALKGSKEAQDVLDTTMLSWYFNYVDYQVFSYLSITWLENVFFKAEEKGLDFELIKWNVVYKRDITSEFTIRVILQKQMILWLMEAIVTSTTGSGKFQVSVIKSYC